MRVAVLVLNWCNASDTIAAIESLRLSTAKDYKIIVCDNASGDGSEEAFLQWASCNTGEAAPSFITEHSGAIEIASAMAHRVVWVATGANGGFAAGNNVGLRIAMRHGAFEYFWLLNNDCLVDSDAMSALIARMESDQSIGICGAQVRYVNPAGRVQAYGGARHNRWTGCAKYIGHLAAFGETHPANNVEAGLSYVCGASMFVRRELLANVGLLREDYFLYFEEIDWALRAKGRYRLGYCPDAVVYHKEGATIGSSSDTRSTSRLADFYLFRNRLRFTKRFFPYALPSVWIVMFLQALRRGLRGQRDRMWLILAILFGRGTL